MYNNHTYIAMYITVMQYSFANFGSCTRPVADGPVGWFQLDHFFRQITTHAHKNLVLPLLATVLKTYFWFSLLLLLSTFLQILVTSSSFFDTMSQKKFCARAANQLDRFKTGGYGPGCMYLRKCLNQNLWHC